MPAIGTRAWMAQTEGRLRLRDRLAYLWQGIAARRAAGRALPPPARDPAGLRPPDSDMARAALAFAEAETPRWMVNHSLRAYLWARLLDDGTRPFDDEVVFVALMLHDLGLADGYAPAGPTPCFTKIGADEAERLAARHGWPGPRARLTAEAITLHLNLTVADRFGREAQLVQLGTVADVVGAGLRVLPTAALDAVCARHPRHGFVPSVTAACAREASGRPACRMAVLVRSLGLAGLIARARFPA